MPNRLPTQEVIDAYVSDPSATLDAIAARFGASPQGVLKLLRRNAVPYNGRRRGSAHPNWKGGRRRNRAGYVRVWIDPSDPMAVMVPPSEKSSHVLEHRLVMARSLNRPLRSDEEVHHKNDIKDDNRLDNLQLRVLNHGNGIALCCADCGSINLVPKEL